MVAEPRAQAFTQLPKRQGLGRPLVEQVAAGRHDGRQVAGEQDGWMLQGWFA
jgi:hypothetical protein